MKTSVRYGRLGMTLAVLAVLGGVNWVQEWASARAVPARATDASTVALVQSPNWPVPDGELEAMVRQVVSAILPGGWSSLVHSGDTVVIKPNLVWEAPPDEGYTTDPRVVRALVRLAREAGAGRIVIADGAAAWRSGKDARGATVEAFRVGGYDADGDLLDDETGVELVDLNDSGGLDQHDPSLVTQVYLPQGLIWKSYWLPRLVIEANVLVGVPVLKNHSYAGVSLSLKNQIGIAPNDLYHAPNSTLFKDKLSHAPGDLGRHIVDLNLARPLDLVVVDGLRGMLNGPVGGTLADPRMKLLIASADAVAADTIGALVMGYDPATVPYLAQAAQAGLGNTDVSRIAVRGERVSRVRRDFPAPYGNIAAQRAESSPPTVRLVEPAMGERVNSVTTLQANAADNGSIVRVEFYADDRLVASASAPPYQATVDLSAYRSRAVQLKAVAYDRALNDAEHAVSVLVDSGSPAGAASFYTTTINILTYPYTPCLKTRTQDQYTYRWLDRRNCDLSVPIPHDYSLLAMENDYVLATVLPELGGRVYQLIDKTTGHNQLYQNPVLKPTAWGPLLASDNWWLAAGGIEWGLPVEEHGYEWGEPWAWSAVTSTGGVTVTLWNPHPSSALRAAVEIAVPADRGYVAIAPHLENPTSQPIGYKYWLNALVAPGAANSVNADLHFVFKAREMYLHDTGDWDRFACTQPITGPTCRFAWPVDGTRDWSRLGNWHNYVGFFEAPQAAANFTGVYDTSADEGLVRVFPSNVARGSKGYGVGWSKPVPPSGWTDDGSLFVELHGGVAPTFWDTAVLTPSTTLAWQEYWYPVSQLGVFTDATREAALSIREEGGSLRLGVNSTRAREHSSLQVWEQATCAYVGRLSVPSIDPAHPFSGLVSLGGRAASQVTVAYVDADANVLVGNPANCLVPDARVQPLPPFVESATFTLTWAMPITGARPVSYTVQVRDGYEGGWADWLTSTQAISATFTGEHGHTYFFRARSLAGNQPAFDEDEWGQAFTTVLTQPAPVLVTSRKTAVWEKGLEQAGTLFVPLQVISYTVTLSNTGNLTAAAIITDALPAGLRVLTETLRADHGVPVLLDGALVWQDQVQAGESVRIGFAAAPEAVRRGDRITNTVEIAGSVLGPFTRQAVLTYAWQVYLPLLMRP